MSRRKSNLATRRAGSHTVFLGRSGGGPTVEESEWRLAQIRSRIAIVRSVVRAYAPSATGDEIIGRFLAISATVQKDPGVFDRIQRRTNLEARHLWRIFSLYPGRDSDLWGVGRELLELFAQEYQLNPNFVFRYGPETLKTVRHVAAPSSHTEAGSMVELPRLKQKVRQVGSTLVRTRNCRA